MKLNEKLYEELLSKIAYIMQTINYEDDVEYVTDHFNSELIYIPLANEEIKQRFLNDLKGIVQEELKKSVFSPFNENYGSLGDTVRSIAPTLYNSLQSFSKKLEESNEEFNSLMREISLYALISEKKLVNQFYVSIDDKNTLDALKAERILVTLNSIITKVKLQTFLEKKIAKKRELINNSVSGEIERSSYSKQFQIVCDEIDLLELAME